MGSGAIRIGGLCGIVAAATILPAYNIGSPEKPRNPADVQGYHDSAASFLTFNGELPLLHILFGLIFVGVLVTMLRQASGSSFAGYIAVIGGAVFLALTAAGLAAEIAVPAAIVKFDDLSVVAYSGPFLMMSLWLYHFSQLGSAALIFATAFIVWRTGVLPKWSAVLAVLGVLPLLHTCVGLPAAYSTVAWVALTSLVMLAIPPVVKVESIGV
ncbi:MAG: hypothetical protein QOD39_1707 [Mycobacterium sp.]|jgi:hypothetical protein|nr:hypothetical protein [Mycobacterium sp.]